MERRVFDSWVTVSADRGRVPPAYTVTATSVGSAKVTFTSSASFLAGRESRCGSWTGVSGAIEIAGPLSEAAKELFLRMELGPETPNGDPLNQSGRRSEIR